jgi:hypothetical protein
MTKYKFNPKKADLNNLDINKIKKYVNEVNSLLGEIKKIDVSDVNQLKSSIKWVSNVDKKAKKLEKNVNNFLGDFLEEDEKNLDSKK